MDENSSRVRRTGPVEGNHEPAAALDQRWVMNRRLLLQRAAVGGIGVSGLSSFLAACGGDKAATKAASGSKTPKDTLVIAFDSDIDTLDPTFANLSRTGQTALVNSLEGLKRYPPIDTEVRGIKFVGVDTTKLGAALATSFEIDGDRAVYTLREGAQWADGTPINARTLKQSYERSIEAGGLAGFLLGVVTVKDASYVEAIDDTHFALRMDTPNRLVFDIEIMSNLALSPTQWKEHATRKDPAAKRYFQKNLPVASGPYVIASYEAGNQVRLEANPDYYGDKPSIPNVVQKIVTDPAQRLLLVKSGEVDIATVPAPQDLKGLESDSNLQVLSVPSIGQVRLYMNNKIAPFDDKLVRQAVNYAMPYEDLVKQVVSGYGGTFKSVVPEGMPTSDSSSWNYATDPKKASDLLAQAGHPGGDGLPELTLTIQSGSAESQRAGVLVQSALSAIGMKATIQQLPLAGFNEQKQARRLQLFIAEDISFVNDPFYWMTLQIPLDGPNNFVNYDNPAVADLCTKWLLSTDVEGRENASKEAQRIINEDAPWAYLYSPNFNIVLRSGVKGYRYYNDALMRFAEMSKS